MRVLRAAAVAALLAGVASGCASSGAAQTPAPGSAAAWTPGPIIQSSASAEVRVAPDRAAISLGVMTRGSSVAQASAENARRQQAVIAAVRAQGIPAERIATMGYNVHPDYRHDPRGEREPTISGYTVNNTIRVEVHQIERVGQIIDAALGAGANNMHGLNFWSSNVDDARRRALAEAVSRARADAEAMAQAAGGQLGPLESMSHGIVPSFPPPMPMARMQMDAAVSAETPISAGEQTLTVTVMGRWGFRPR
jgi:uncharacterized protein